MRFIQAQAEFVLQHYIRASHGRDVRVLVVGGRVVAAMERRSQTGGFKSNVSLGGSAVAYNPPQDMVELAVRAAETLDLDVTGIDILFDEDGYRICEANSAPGFQGLERATGLDVPGAILRWIATTHDQPPPESALAEGDAIVDLVFGGRAALRAIGDRNIYAGGFASAVGLRLIAAGLNCLARAAFPSVLVDRRGRTELGLKALFDVNARRIPLGFDDTEAERILIVTLAVSIWAAVIPWLVGADAAISGALSVIALLFPIGYLLTAPSRGIRNIAARFQRTNVR